MIRRLIRAWRRSRFQRKTARCFHMWQFVHSFTPANAPGASIMFWYCPKCERCASTSWVPGRYIYEIIPDPLRP